MLRRISIRKFPNFLAASLQGLILISASTTGSIRTKGKVQAQRLSAVTNLLGLSLCYEKCNKPRNARTARIVKAREPQQVESRKRVLLFHGTKCPQPVASVLKTVHTLTKPDSVLLHKKNENIYPFEDTASIEFLAQKNECGVVVFGTHSKKRPNNITIVRIYDGKVLDMVELLLLVPADQPPTEPKMEVGVGMKPLILFSGSQWDDPSSSAQATLYQTLKSTLLDLFQGEEVPSIDVVGLQYVLMIASGESTSSSGDLNNPADKPVLHLRWYKIRTVRSNNAKIPRVELDPMGPSFDFRVSRHREADSAVMADALKHGRRPNEARTKKNIETDLVGDKIGRVHLGKQDLSTLQTRKMKGLKRGRDNLGEDQEGRYEGRFDQDDLSDDEDLVDGGMDVDDEVSEGGSSGGGSGDEISIGDDDAEMGEGDDADDKPKRQRIS
ncbi:valyl-tRNA synthetase [Capronia epimyces CBS 606.96]|uniref:Ribosome production factor 2 homolog n=1 Tax=Capronia epimyces CBS 606.96 TaxID=1182542 RepID=W9YCV8_9EURO|nr:valyl-tRNA synthetase [Capronia epimyces CBS 606.96]EXJ87091.1 valyl-tRNA synthetase [Capronia epimyces CBS 606.96]